jgi:hypothetical protein
MGQCKETWLRNKVCAPVKDLVDCEAGEKDHPEPEQHEYLTCRDQLFLSC